MAEIVLSFGLIIFGIWVWPEIQKISKSLERIADALEKKDKK